MSTTYQPGTVLTYQTDRSAAGERDAYWCREGMAVVNDDGIALDTFWQSSSEAHRLTSTELERAEVLFELREFDELDRWRPDRQKWLTYAAEDRQSITSQHQLEQRLFLRKGAKPHRETVLDNLRTAMAEAESEFRSAERRLQHAQEDLAALEAAPADCSCRPSFCTRSECVACAGVSTWTDCKALPVRLGGAA